MTVPGVSFYCASKYAVEGLMEAVGKEVAPFGVRVTLVEPGSFRTDWAGRSMIRAERSISDYDDMFEPLREARRKASGGQLGDPVRAAEAVLTVLESSDLPTHLVLGSDALRLVRSGRESVEAEINMWEELSRSTDFTEGGHRLGSD